MEDVQPPGIFKEQEEEEEEEAFRRLVELPRPQQPPLSREDEFETFLCLRTEQRVTRERMRRDATPSQRADWTDRHFGEARWHSHIRSQVIDPLTRTYNVRPKMDTSNLNVLLRQLSTAAFPEEYRDESLYTMLGRVSADDAPEHAYAEQMMDRMVRLAQLVSVLGFEGAHNRELILDPRTHEATKRRLFAASPAGQKLRFTITNDHASNMDPYVAVLSLPYHRVQGLIVTLHSRYSARSVMFRFNMNEEDVRFLGHFWTDNTSDGEARSGFLPERASDCFGRDIPRKANPSTTRTVHYYDSPDGWNKDDTLASDVFMFPSRISDTRRKARPTPRRSVTRLVLAQDPASLGRGLPYDSLVVGRPDIGSGRDPVNDAGIYQDYFVCCGQSLNNEGCFIDVFSARTNKSKPYRIFTRKDAERFYARIRDQGLRVQDLEQQDLEMFAHSIRRGTAWIDRQIYDQWHAEIVAIADRVSDSIAALCVAAEYTTWSEGDGILQFVPFFLTTMPDVVKLYTLIAEYNGYRCQGQSLQELPQSPLEWIQFFITNVMHLSEIVPPERVPAVQQHIQAWGSRLTMMTSRVVRGAETFSESTVRSIASMVRGGEEVLRELLRRQEEHEENKRRTTQARKDEERVVRAVAVPPPKPSPAKIVPGPAPQPQPFVPEKIPRPPPENIVPVPGPQPQPVVPEKVPSSQPFKVVPPPARVPSQPQPDILPPPKSPVKKKTPPTPFIVVEQPPPVVQVVTTVKVTPQPSKVTIVPGNVPPKPTPVVPGKEPEPEPEPGLPEFSDGEQDDDEEPKTPPALEKFDPRVNVRTKEKRTPGTAEEEDEGGDDEPPQYQPFSPPGTPSQEELDKLQADKDREQQRLEADQKKKEEQEKEAARLKAEDAEKQRLLEVARKKKVEEQQKEAARLKADEDAKQRRLEADRKKRDEQQKQKEAARLKTDEDAKQRRLEADQKKEEQQKQKEAARLKADDDAKQRLLEVAKKKKAQEPEPVVVKTDPAVELPSLDEDEEDEQDPGGLPSPSSTPTLSPGPSEASETETPKPKIVVVPAPPPPAAKQRKVVDFVTRLEESPTTKLVGLAGPVKTKTPLDELLAHQRILRYQFNVFRQKPQGEYDADADEVTSLQKLREAIRMASVETRDQYNLFYHAQVAENALERLRADPDRLQAYMQANQKLAEDIPFLENAMEILSVHRNKVRQVGNMLKDAKPLNDEQVKDVADEVTGELQNIDAWKDAVVVNPDVTHKNAIRAQIAADMLRNAAAGMTERRTRTKTATGPPPPSKIPAAPPKTKVAAKTAQPKKEPAAASPEVSSTESDEDRQRKERIKQEKEQETERLRADEERKQLELATRKKAKEDEDERERLQRVAELKAEEDRKQLELAAAQKKAKEEEEERERLRKAAELKAEEDRQQRVLEERRKREEDELKRMEEQNAAQEREQLRLEAERKAREEREAAAALRAEEERQKRVLEAQKRKEEEDQRRVDEGRRRTEEERARQEERLRREEQERLRREEEERQRVERERLRLAQDEAQRKRREDEERLRREQEAENRRREQEAEDARRRQQQQQEAQKEPARRSERLAKKTVVKTEPEVAPPPGTPQKQPQQQQQKADVVPVPSPQRLPGADPLRRLTAATFIPNRLTKDNRNKYGSFTDQQISVLMYLRDMLRTIHEPNATALVRGDPGGATFPLWVEGKFAFDEFNDSCLRVLCSIMTNDMNLMYENNVLVQGDLREFFLARPAGILMSYIAVGPLQYRVDTLCGMVTNYDGKPQMISGWGTRYQRAGMLKFPGDDRANEQRKCIYIAGHSLSNFISLLLHAMTTDEIKNSSKKPNMKLVTSPTGPFGKFFEEFAAIVKVHQAVEKENDGVDHPAVITLQAILNATDKGQGGGREFRRIGEELFNTTTLWEELLAQDRARLEQMLIGAPKKSQIYDPIKPADEKQAREMAAAADTLQNIEVKQRYVVFGAKEQGKDASPVVDWNEVEINKRLLGAVAKTYVHILMRLGKDGYVEKFSKEGEHLVEMGISALVQTLSTDQLAVAHIGQEEFEKLVPLHVLRDIGLLVPMYVCQESKPESEDMPQCEISITVSAGVTRHSLPGYKNVGGHNIQEIVELMHRWGILAEIFALVLAGKKVDPKLREAVAKPWHHASSPTSQHHQQPAQAAEDIGSWANEYGDEYEDVTEEIPVKPYAVPPSTPAGFWQTLTSAFSDDPANEPASIASWGANEDDLF